MRADRLRYILEAQARQQESIYGPIIGEDQRRDIGIQLATYLGEEVYDYLNQLGFKHYLPPVDRSDYARKMEVVDLLKYALALAWVEGMNEDELFHMFCDKTDIVQMREAQLSASARIAAIDIDGVLANIRAGGYDSSWTIEAQDAWMVDGNILRLQPIDRNIQALRSLRKLGWQIVLVTSRKRHRHKAIEMQTYQWLETYAVPYDKVIWGHDKVEAMVEAGIRPSIYADDSPKHAIDVAGWGVKTYLLDDGELELSHPQITRMDNLLAISELLESATDQYMPISGIAPPE